MIELSIITVTYNNELTIQAYLKSLFNNLPKKSEVIIIDNASTDKTVELIKNFPRVNLITSKANLGFSKGSNLGAKKAKGEFLLFLNPDTKVLTDGIKELISFAKKNPKIGIVAPKLILKNGEAQPSVRKLPTILGVIKEYYFNIKNSFCEYVPQGKDPAEVECVYGAALMIRKDIFEKLNGFDEKFFLYYEDLDLCRRLKNLNLKIIYYPKAKIEHKVGTSSKKLSVQTLPFGLRTLAHFFPNKNTGSNYYQIRGANLYHGFVKASVIRAMIFLSVKLGIRPL